MAKLSFSKKVPPLLVAITRKKNKKINLDKTTPTPTDFFINIFNPPRYLPNISPILYEVNKINIPHPF